MAHDDVMAEEINSLQTELHEAEQEITRLKKELSSIKAAGTRADGIEAAAKASRTWLEEHSWDDDYPTIADGIEEAIRALSPASPREN